MAKTTMSGIGITEMRGKLSAEIHSRNRGGNYSKAYVIPFDPATPLQIDIRSAMGIITGMWQSLTDDERLLWNAAAGSKFSARGSRKRALWSGFNYFCHCAWNCILAGGMPLVVPPEAGFADHVTSITVNALTPTDFNISAALAGAGSTPFPSDVVIFFATAPVSVGITSKQNGFAGFYGVDNSGSLSNQDVLSEYTQVFGAPVSGQKIFIRAKCYNYSRGQQSKPWQISAIVS